MKVLLIIIILILGPGLLWAGDPDSMIEVGKGKPWELISMAAGAAAGALLTSVGKKTTALINALLDVWIYKLRAKIKKLDPPVS